MKVIKKVNLLQNQYTSNNLPQEIHILSQLNSPYTTNFFEYFEDKKLYYILTELCEGHNLYDYISEKGFFNEKTASIIIKKVLKGLFYIHNLGIVHRDIKPENVLFSSPFNLDIKIADFGGACEKKLGQRLKGIFGSKYYLAPEVLKGGYNEKVDIWSCGIMTYIIITGQAPYGDTEDDKISEVFLKPFQLDKENAKGLSEECRSFIEMMIMVDPEERMSAKDALKHKWLDIGDNM
jgi:serine/threonine protein kinase